MNVDQRIEQVLFSTALGPVAPLYGIIQKDGELRCECGGKSRNCSPGKHPRNVQKYQPTTDLIQISEWFRKFPNANFGVHVGASGIFSLDADVRPEQEKMV